MAPELRFLGQPRDEQGTTGAFVRTVLADRRIDTLTIAVAWVRFRGLARLKDEIATFRKRGGRLRAVVGIDEGGGTLPGLLGIATMADEAFVYHDRRAVTFHPKVYLATGSTLAKLLVGSSNLTPGGLWINYETSLEAAFRLPREAKHPALVGAREYIDRLVADDACMALDADFAYRLLADGRYRIAPDEHSARRVSAITKGVDPHDLDPVGGAQNGDLAQGGHARSGVRRHLFPASSRRLASLPKLSADAQGRLRELERGSEPDGQADPSAKRRSRTGKRAPRDTRQAASAGRARSGGGQGQSQQGMTRIWSKILSRGDAQHSPRGNVTGVLRLAQAKHPIDHRTWFRHELFGEARWQTGRDRNGKRRETATIEFDVTIGEDHLGPTALEIDHAPHREAGQNNVTTILHWGPLGAELRARDHSDETVTLERLRNGKFRLTIA